MRSLLGLCEHRAIGVILMVLMKKTCLSPPGRGDGIVRRKSRVVPRSAQCEELWSVREQVPAAIGGQWFLIH